jgi:hypothetical protein
MEKPQKAPLNLSLIIGIAGMLAGIALIFSENRMIGIFSSIACFGLVYRGIQERRSLKK